MKRSGLEDKNEAIAQKNVKKGVDKAEHMRYTLIIPCDTELILENDTESRRTRTRFSRVVSEKDSQFVNEF